MRVEGLELHLRPRPMAEAADLGLALVHRHAASVLRVWLPLYLAVALIALATAEIGGWLPFLVIFLAKPWLDRSLLFVLARAVFGNETRWADLWAERRGVWWRELAWTLTVRRLSPWRSYTQAIGQLEGQRGAARRQRRNQLLRARRGAACGMHFVFAHVEMVLYLGMLSLAVWFAPQGMRGELFRWLAEAEGWGNQLVLNSAYLLTVFFVEPFYVAAGFAMYLNRRVELEAWDVEQEFRRAFA